MHDTEDKAFWVNQAHEVERDFVSKICPDLGLKAEINPEKVTNPYTADLIVNGNLSELKNPKTPFLKATELYGLPYQTTVTFNYKDYERYKKLHPELVLYFWVIYSDGVYIVGNREYKVNDFSGVWVMDFKHIQRYIETKKAPLHVYQKRMNDTRGNGKSSFLLNLRWLECLCLF